MPKNPRSLLSDLLTPIFVLLPILWALLPGGLPSTADGQVHFIRAAEMVQAWQAGIWIPRWSANLGLGLGIPLFIYAPPLPYFITAALHQLGLPLDAALKGTMMVALLLTAYGAYHLARDLLGGWAGAVCAAAVIYAPILLRELFIQGNVGQLLAWAFIPWTLWGVLRLFGGGGWRYAIWLALAVVGVMLSHNAVALLLAELTTAEMLILWMFTRRGRAFRQAVAGGCLGLVLSAWFWLPALLEGKYIQLDKIAASDYHNRFLKVTELVALSPRLDTGAINPYYPLTLGVAQVTLGLLGMLGLPLFAWLSSDRRARQGEMAPAAMLVTGVPAPAAPDISISYLIGAGTYFTGLALFGAFMALKISAPVWETLPFMDLLEFPFRWHGFTVIGLAWLAAFAIFLVQRTVPSLGSWAATGALLLLIGSAVVNLYPDKLPPGLWAASPADVVRYEAKTGAVGTTSLGEFTPIWPQRSLIELSPFVNAYPPGGLPNRLPEPLPDGAGGKMLNADPQTGAYALALTRPQTLTFALLFFPGWEARAGNSPLAVAAQAQTGLLTVAAPAGEYTLWLTYAGSPLRRSMEILSLASWGVLVGVVTALVLRARGRPRPAAATPAPAMRSATQASVLIAAGVIALLAIAARDLAPGWFRIESSPDQALPAAVPLRGDFADKVRVLGLDLAPTIVQPGEALELAVYLRALHRLHENYGLFLHLDRPDGTTVAAVDVLHPADIPTRGWATGLYVRAPLKLTVPPDALPIRYALRLGVTDPSGAWLPVAGSAEDALAVGEVWVEPAQPPTPLPGPRARFGEQIELLGAKYDPAAGAVHLYWRANGAVERDLSIFVHFVDTAGNILGQADGTPYANLYPVRAWRPGQIIEDVRPLPEGLQPGGGLAGVLIGFYDPSTGERLAALDAENQLLPDQSVRIDLQ